jgi:hypothetical protein
MGVTDLRTDINAEIRLAQTIGKGIGSFVRGRRERREAEEAGERKRIQQAETLRIMSSDATPEEKLRALNGMGDVVNNKFVQRMNEKRLEKELMAGKESQDEKIKRLNALQKTFEATQELDVATGQSVTKPGMETLAAGSRQAIKDLTADLFGVMEQPAEPTVEEPVEEEGFISRTIGGIKEKVQAARAERRPPPAGPEGTIGEFIERKKKQRESPPFTNPLTGEPQLRFNLEGKVVAIGGKPLPQPITVKQAKALRAGELDKVAERRGGDTRADGTKKGLGFFGELQRPDGKVSTELSIGVGFDGKDTEIPLLVPTLTKQEIDWLLSGKKATKTIVDKAVAHARKRMKDGKSPFAEQGEQQRELDADTALEILREAGGDKDKAREIARDRGFKF